MSAPDISEKQLTPLRRSNFREHFTILLGAGASIPSGSPDWNELAVRLLLRSGSMHDESVARRFVEHQDPLIVADGIRKRLGDDWVGYVRAALYGDRVWSPSSMVLAAAHYALVHERKQTILATLNFDRLLEKALDFTNDELENANAPRQSSPDNIVVYHLHGTLTEEGASDDFVLTFSDLYDGLSQQAPWQLELLSTAVELGPIAVIGTTYRDPDLRQWLHQALKTRHVNHENFVFIVRQAFGVSREEFDKMLSPLRDQWEALGFTPIPLDDYTDAAQLLWELSYVDKRNYCSPQERCRKIYAAHIRDFELLQEAHVKRLEKNADEVKEYFKTSDVDISLWLADGVGSLVRWAVHDRVYRHDQNLLHVQSGYDSPYVAGRALAEENVIKHEDIERPADSRWNSVLAIPIRLRADEEHPQTGVAVLTIGLPEESRRYLNEGALNQWILVFAMASEWSKAISNAGWKQ